MVVIPEVTLEMPLHNIMGYYDLPFQANPECLNGINMVLYSGYPGSPLNGGRLNGSVDDPRVPGTDYFELLTGVVPDGLELGLMREYYFQCITEANTKGIPVYLTYTNYFPMGHVFNDPEVAQPINKLVESSKETGVRNGVIVANKHVEEWARVLSGGELDIICSATSFYNRNRLLSRDERLKAYHEATQKYDLVVMTPPDASIDEILSRIPDGDKSKMVAVVNSPCLEHCPSWWHYAYFSILNRSHTLSLEPSDERRFASEVIMFAEQNLCMNECDVKDRDVAQRVRQLLSYGFRNLKIGRTEVSGATTEDLTSFEGQLPSDEHLCQTLDGIKDWHNSISKSS